MHSDLCGVYYIPRDDGPTQRLPLVSLSAHATICQNSSRLVVKQAFANPGSKAIGEAAYSFPIYEGAAIVGFTCRIADRVIEGVIREKNEAKQLYEKAKERGQQAALMLQNTPDVWSTRISNVPAGGTVEVEITTVCELKHDAQVDGIRFVLPAKIAPRYGQEPENLPPSIGQKASRGIEMTVAVTMTSPITSLQSPSHPIAVGIGTHVPNESLSKEGIDVCKGYATLSQNATVLEKDFVLILVSADIGKPQAILETHPELPGGQRALLLSLVPKFDLPRIKPEIVFIADRSGSMEDNIAQLRNALKVFLRSLPVGVKFNICSFGDRYTFLWPKSRAYDQDNLDIALKHVEKFEADYGGTEMFPPVEEALKNRYKDMQTEIIILTDGEIWETEPLFDLVQKECESGEVRLFSVGVGDSVSHALVEGLARAGKGYAQIVGNEDKLDAKLVRMLKAALGAHVSNYKLVFPDSATGTKNSEGEDKEAFEFVEHEKTSDHTKTEAGQEDGKQKIISLYDTSSGKSHGDEPAAQEGRFSHLPGFEPPARLQTPHQIPPLFPFSRTNVYVFLSASAVTPQSVTVQGTTTSGDRLELEVPVTDIGIGTTVHQLAAKKLLQELEEGGSYLGSGQLGVDPVKDEGKFVDWVTREGIRVGMTFGVAGKWTSFVAVENAGELEQQPQPTFVPQRGATFKSASFISFRSLGANVMRPSLRIGVSSPMPLSQILPPPSGCSRGVGSNSPAGGIHAVQGQQQTAAESPTAKKRNSEISSNFLKFSENLKIPKAAHFIHRALKDQCKASGLSNADFARSKLECEELRDLLGGELDCEVEQQGSGIRTLVDAGSKGSSEKNRTYELLNMQGFDGSFPAGSGDWAAHLISAFHTWMQEDHGQEVGGVRALTEELLGKVIASAVAIAIFEGELKNCKDIWEMAVEKTEEWGIQTVGDTTWKALKIWASQEIINADEQKRQSFWAK